MSKYIIELNDKCARGIVVFGKKDEEVISTTQYVENLEVLNSDYINEHFGDLQDTAYQRGLEDGKAVNGKGCEGCKYGGTPQGDTPCFNCSNYYKNNWTADKIEVGDEVIFNNTMKCLVVKPESDESYASLIDSNGNHHSAENCDFKKTGRHFDIQSILEALRP